MSTESNPTTKAPRRRPPRWVLLGIFFVGGAVLSAAVLAMLMSVFGKQQESAHPYFQVVQLDEKTIDPQVWGQNFPMQYESFKKTAEMPAAEQAPRTPTADDPRTVKAHSKLEADPRLVTMWQGYAFSVEYNEPRGHEYMLEDQRLVKRVTQFKQPGACLNCHASLPEVLNNIGGDPDEAWAKMNKTPYNEATKWANHPVACIDCHDPATMKLRVTRPAFINGIKAYKAGQGIKDYDVNKQATANEMRAFVCAQCHVEYYFAGEGKTLTFPWDKGLKVEDAEAYYDEIGWSDFTHKLTGAQAIKAQHPDFETWSQGVHATAGVTCADCHMGYTRTGAAKVTDHQIASPMRNDATINATCLTCHNTTEKDMKDRVSTIHDRYEHAKNISFDALDDLIKDIEKAAKDGTATEDQLNKARAYQRTAQFYTDYVVSENSRGFHAPAYTIRILNDVTDNSRKGQLVLRGVDPEKTPGPQTSASPSPTNG